MNDELKITEKEFDSPEWFLKHNSDGFPLAVYVDGTIYRIVKRSGGYLTLRKQEENSNE